MDLRVGGGIEHLTVLIMNTNKHIDGQLFCALEWFDWDKPVLELSKNKNDDFQCYSAPMRADGLLLQLEGIMKAAAGCCVTSGAKLYYFPSNLNLFLPSTLSWHGMQFTNPVFVFASLPT